MEKKLMFVFFVAFLTFFATGCRLNFKAEKLNIEALPPEARIGLNENIDQTFKLASIDIMNNSQ